MSLQSRISALITAIGADVKALQARTPDYFGDGSDGAWTAQVTPTNVLANPNPDVNVTGWAGFFTGGGSGFGPNRVADTAFGGSFAFELGETTATGAGVMLLYPADTASFVGSVANVVPGQVVDFTGQVKAQAGTFSSLKLTARWLKADGSLISEVDVTGAVQNTPVVGTVYSLSGSLTAPANAAYAGVEAIGSFAGSGSYTMRIANLASRPLMPGSTRSGAVYTLTRDVYFTDLTVNTGVTIDTHGYRIYCRGTLSGAGTISSNGLASTSRSAGTGGLPGSVSGGSIGGDGGLQNGAGTAAPAVGRGHGGIGGAGGAGGFAGGAAPTSPLPPLGGIRRSLNELVDAVWWNTTAAAMQVIFGGGGGSGGGGSSAAAGGGGGGGGGIVIVAVRVLSGTLAFAAKGGAGGAALGTNAGGGGGGGGGAIHLLYGNKLGWSGTTDVSGGALGAKNGTGVNGVAGAAGNVIQLAVVNDGPVQPTAWGPWTAIPFAANWGNYGSGNQDGQYRVSADGKTVQLRGLIKITGATITLGGANSNPTTLPAGARPPAPTYYSQYVVAAGTTNTTVLIGIAPTGIMTMWSELSGRSLTFSTGTYVSLDGIQFSTET